MADKLQATFHGSEAEAVAKIMYETRHPYVEDALWPPKHPDNYGWWLAMGQAVLDAGYHRG